MEPAAHGIGVSCGNERKCRKLDQPLLLARPPASAALTRANRRDDRAFVEPKRRARLGGPFEQAVPRWLKNHRDP